MMWWRDKVAYQIYPKSFMDSNGDGIGDLRGIIQKLDYIKDLGVDIIWISPIYESPMLDQGYDISNYCKINPMFGTMEDMDELLVEAKKRDLYILMDLVINHCSDQHEWFQEVLKDPEGEYADYFYIREAENGKLPCNWRSYFGGSVWEPIPGTDKYYFHSFHKSQPDLNWENPVVRRKLYDMVSWWLEKGVDGFRIDAIINIKKQLEFKDYEADREDGLSSLSNMLQEAEGIEIFLNELKEETFKKYQAFTVGEVFNVTQEEKAKFIGEDGCFSTIFDFSIEEARTGDNWHECVQLTPEEIKKLIFKSQGEVPEGCVLANVIENHDEPRGASAFFTDKNHCDERKTMLATAYMLLPGIPFVYQGQELGMTNTAYESIDIYDDVATKDQYQVAIDAGYSPEEALSIVAERSRDNGRTPMHWSAKAHGGFTNGTPWLKANANYPEINVEMQVNDQGSVLENYKAIIQLRKSEQYINTFVNGSFLPYMEHISNLLAYYRIDGENKILVLCNYQEEETIVPVETEMKSVVYANYGEVHFEEEKLRLGGYQAVVLAI